MELYEIEQADAVTRLSEIGKSTGDFLFDRAYLPPEPDGGGMFTVQYEVMITNRITSKSLEVIGGIGWKWVDQFEDALQDCYFD